MGIKPGTKFGIEAFEEEQRQRAAQQAAEQGNKTAKARVLATNKKNLAIAHRSGKANLLVVNPHSGKATVLIGDGHDPQFVKQAEADGIHGHMDVTDHGIVVTGNMRGAPFEVAMKKITPAKISYK